MQEDIQINSEDNQVFQNTLKSLASPEEPEVQGLLEQSVPVIGSSALSEYMGMLQEGTDLNTNLEDIRKESHELNYEKTKQLMHDTAYFDSAEYAVRNMLASRKYDKQYSKELTPLEANSLSKDLGSDIKFERNVTEGRVRLAVERGKQKQYLEEQLASYRELGNYSAWENLALAGSAISGSVGAAELLGTAALAALMPAAGGAIATSRTLAAVARAVPMAKKFTVGITLAQKAIVAEKRAREAGRALSAVSKYANKARELGGATAYAFDAFRMTKGAVGTRAALGSTASAFALDSAISDMPRIAIMSANSMNMQDESYTLKQALAETMLAGVFGAALPIAGTLGKPIKSTTRQIFDGIAAKRAAKAREEVVKAITTGRGSDEEIEKVAAQIYQNDTEVRQLIAEDRPVRAQQQAANVIANENMTDTEFSAAVNYVDQSMGGNIPSVPDVDGLPLKTRFMSKVGGAYNFFKEAVEKGISNFDLRDQLSSILKITGIKGRSLETGLMATSKIANEAGALGKFAAAGFDEEQSMDFLLNAYRYHLAGDEQAKALMVQSLDRMKTAKQLMDKLIATYDNIYNLNKKGAKIKRAQQMRMYELLDGTPTNFKRALEEVISYMVSDSDERLYQQAKQILTNAEVMQAVAGRPDLAEKYGVRIAEEIMEERENLVKLVADYDEREFFDLVKRTGDKGETVTLKNLSDDLAEAITNNESLLNAESLFKEQYGNNPEKMIAKMQNVDATPAKAGEGFGKEEATHQEVRELTEGEKARDASLERLYRAEEELDLAKDDLDIPIESYINGKVDEEGREELLRARESGKKAAPTLYDMFVKAAASIQSSAEKGTKTMGSFFDELNKRIIKINDILHQSITGEASLYTHLMDNWYDDLVNSKASFFSTIKGKPAKYVRKVLTGNRSYFKRSIKSMIIEPLIKEAEGFSGSLYKLNDTLDEVAEKFLERLGQEGSDTLATLERRVSGEDIEKAKNILSDKSSSEVVKTAVKEELDRAQVQRQIIQEVLNPLKVELDRMLQDEAMLAMQTQKNMLQTFKRMLINPSMGYEVLMSNLTFSPLNLAQGAMSVENLANVTDVFRRFDQKLFMKTPGTTVGDKITSRGQDLRAYAYDPANFKGIRKALYNITKYGDAAEVRKKGIQMNDADAVVAEAYLDTMAGLQKNLYNVGAGGKSPVKFFDSTALAQASWLIPADIGMPVFKSIEQGLSGEGFEPVLDMFRRFLPDTIEATEKRGAKYLSKGPVNEVRNSESFNNSKSNLALYFFRDLDLDKHIGTTNTGVSYNELRDAIIGGKPEDMEALLAKMPKYYNGNPATRSTKIMQLREMMADITEGIAGSNSPKRYRSGLITKLGVGSSRVTDLYKAGRSKFLEDLDEKLAFKDDKAFEEALEYFGHRDLKSWFHRDFGTAKGAYAVLSKVGAEPMRFVEDMINIWNTAMVQKGQNFLGKKATDRSILTTHQIHSLRASCRTVCGVESIPASTGARVARLVIKIISSPLIIKAGVKSLTDNFYQHRYMLSAGLKQATDVGAIGGIIERMVNVMGSKKLANRLFLNHSLMRGTLQDMLTSSGINADSLAKETRNIAEAIGRNQRYNDYTPALVRWENHAREVADCVINNLAWVGPMTEYNRSNATISIMEAVGAKTSQKYADIFAENPRMAGLLVRHGITPYEWDNLFSKCVDTVDGYTNKWYGQNTGFMGDTRLFFADMMAEIDDAEIAKAIKEQNFHVNEVTQGMIDRYRETLCDKANVLINSGANEMTSLPTARAQNALNLQTPENTVAGELVRAATQYQSFSMAVTYNHYGRLCAQHVDMNNPLFTNVFLSSMGLPMAADLAGFVVMSMLVNSAMDESISYVTGTHKTIGTKKSPVGNLPEKMARTLSESIGIVGPYFDAITSSFESRGNGGGMAIQMLPAASHLNRQAARIYNAATREGTKGQKPQAIGAALAQDAVDMTGLSRHVLTQYWWNKTVGAYLDKWTMGEKGYYARQRRRKNQGYINY